MSLGYNNSELKGKKVIIVEDDIPSVRYYENILINSGASISVFTNGKDFISYLEKVNENIDIVLIDFLIPYVNGIECTRYFRRHHRHTPLLMISAYYSEQTKNEAFIAGCNEYILKPIYPEKLYCIMEKYLNQQVTYSPLR
jgi:PleD family two-component response regulator